MEIQRVNVPTFPFWHRFKPVPDVYHGALCSTVLPAVIRFDQPLKFVVPASTLFSLGWNLEQTYNLLHVAYIVHVQPFTLLPFVIGPASRTSRGERVLFLIFSRESAVSPKTCAVETLFSQQPFELEMMLRKCKYLQNFVVV